MIGRTIGAGRFEIGECIGSGGFAAVYRGRQINLNRSVAIKILNERAANDANLVKRFHHEAAAIAQFDHPNIIKIFDHGEEDGLDFYVMNLLPRALRSRLENGRPLPLDYLLRLAYQLAGALDYAQRTVNHFVHRDIKPENIMLDRDDNAVLSDFGLVRGEQFSVITMGPTVMGTPLYMSPEQIRGEMIDSRSDLYALGVMFYECATGMPPFKGEMYPLFDQHLHQPPQPPRGRRPDLPPALETIILRLLQKAPQDRYASAGELLLALEPLARNLSRPVITNNTAAETPPVSPSKNFNKNAEPELTQPISQIKTSVKKTGRRPYWRRATASLAVFIILAGALWIYSQQGIEPGNDETKKTALGDSSVAKKELSSTIQSSKPPDKATPPETLKTIPALDEDENKSGPMPDTPREIEKKPVAFTPKLQLAPLRVTSIPPSEIFVDGAPPDQAVNGRLAIDISPGAHELTFRHPDYGRAQETVNVREEAGLTYTFNWLGKITVVAADENDTPVAAAIFIDGKPTAFTTPYAGLELPRGPHQIRVSKFEYEMVGAPKTVIIKGGDEQRLTFALRRVN